MYLSPTFARIAVVVAVRVERAPGGSTARSWVGSTPTA
jgi:hypothetical protein